MSDTDDLIKSVTIEGFEDFRGEFDTGIYVCKPVVYCVDASRIENVIEDYCIDVVLGDDRENDDQQLSDKRVMKCFYQIRKKKRTPSFRYFRAVVEIYLDGHPLSEREVYRIVEQEGF